MQRDAAGRLAYNPATCQTNVPAVFAAGEIVTPPGSVVEACASGQRAARAMDLFLSGRPIVLDDSLPPYIGTIAAATGEKVRKVRREPVPTELPELRKTCFAEVDHTYRVSVGPARGAAVHELRGRGRGAHRQVRRLPDVPAGLPVRHPRRHRRGPHRPGPVPGLRHLHRRVPGQRHRPPRPPARAGSRN